jgi:hypothetical protein
MPWHVCEVADHPSELRVLQSLFCGLSACCISISQVQGGAGKPRRVWAWDTGGKPAREAWAGYERAWVLTYSLGYRELEVPTGALFLESWGQSLWGAVLSSQMLWDEEGRQLWLRGFREDLGGIGRLPTLLVMGHMASGPKKPIQCLHFLVLRK